jgi:hypothetical protein
MQQGRPVPVSSFEVAADNGIPLGLAHARPATCLAGICMLHILRTQPLTFSLLFKSQYINPGRWRKLRGVLHDGEETSVLGQTVQSIAQVPVNGHTHDVHWDLGLFLRKMSIGCPLQSRLALC